MSSSSNTLIPVATFTGQSTYSSSFQQVLTRAVQTASLPGELVEASMNTLTSQQQALSSMLSTFASLQGAIQSLDSATQGSIGATVSDATLVSASATSSALPGTYTLTVDDVGSATTMMSNDDLTTVTDPTTGNISNSATFTLNVNGTDTTIAPTGTSLDDLASAINNADAGVQATVVNVGGSSSADYRLALTSSTLGANTIDLDDSGGNSLVSVVGNPGTPAQYSVNGSSEVSSDSDTITLAPGLTVNLLAQDPTTPVTITVASNQNNLSTALGNFATAYNAAEAAVTAQTGQNAGPLDGQSIVFVLHDLLNSITQYGGGPTNIPTLNSLGLEVDETGNMSFNSAKFNNLNPSDITQFLGGTATGGFLQSANDALNSVTDSSTGSLETSINSIQSEITSDQNQVADDTAQVTTLQNALMTQLSAADAAIYTLQSQTTYFTELFQAEYGNNTNGASGS